MEDKIKQSLKGFAEKAKKDCTRIKVVEIGKEEDKRYISFNFLDEGVEIDIQNVSGKEVIITASKLIKIAAKTCEVSKEAAVAEVIKSVYKDEESEGDEDGD